MSLSDGVSKAKTDPKLTAANNQLALLHGTVAFIKELCVKLKLQLLPQCTALVYLHRFVHVQGLEDHDRFVLGCACVFLAAKVEEDSRKLDHVVSAAEKIHDFRSSNVFTSGDKVVRVGKTNDSLGSASTLDTGRNLSSTSGSAIDSRSGFDDGDVDHNSRMTERVLLFERILLHSLSFDVAVAHPHLHAVKVLTKLRPSSNAAALSEYRLVAWNYLNDALYTDLCVRFRPQEIASAAVLMAYFELKDSEQSSVSTKQLTTAIERELSQHRLGVFKVSQGTMEMIFSKIYSVYAPPPAYMTDETIGKETDSTIDIGTVSQSSVDSTSAKRSRAVDIEG